MSRPLPATPVAALLTACLFGPAPLYAGGCAPTGSPEPDSVPDAAASAAARHAGGADLDSARAEMGVGRYWHAARHLRELRAGGMEFGPEETLMLARAEAGYRDWDGVVETLDGRPWLAEEEGGQGLRLLGRALEAREAWVRAAELYGRWLAAPDGRSSTDRTAVQARRARALALAGEADAAVEALEETAAGSPVVASWAALEMAEGVAPAGDTALVRRLLAAVDDPAARDRTWELTAVAVLAAGDSARAVEAYRGLTQAGVPSERRARASRVLGDVALARGDEPAAADHFRVALDAAPGTASGVAAARRLVEMDELGPDRALAAARVLAGAGDAERALVAYDLHVRSAGVESVAEDVRLARARLMADVAARHEEAVRELRALSTSESVEVGAGALDAWADLRRRQERSDDVRTLRERLVERYPSSSQAVQYVFLRGDAAQDRLELDAALRDYERLTTMAPDADRTGLARMRAAQIHLRRGDPGRALSTFRAYAEDFPEGRRWDEATWWAGRILLDTGEGEEGRELMRSIIEREPLSYYAVLAAEVLDTEYRLPGEPGGGGVPAPPEWMREELVVLDLLAAAGLETGRTVRTAALRERALDAPSLDAALSLARELIQRDQGLDGINLGWELRRRGMSWSRALLEVTYPFPYREMVHRAATERGLDPLFVASVIRQESAFDPDIVSRAGAVGLMQIMPATGEQLAEAVGPRDFDAESLVTPEINLHLGTRYLVDLRERYDGSIPLMLSAYNAGPHRADVWMKFEEMADELRFTERIPYGETRDYVKQIRRNIALYEALYGRSPAS